MLKEKFIFIKAFIVLLSTTPEFSKGIETYLDYAASYSIDEEALKVFCDVSRLQGNSSGFNPHAHRLREIENFATSVICRKIKAQYSSQLTYTQNATTANNMAILGVAYKNPGCHLITTKIEHKSILNTFRHLEEKGYKVTYLNVDQSGKINLEELELAIRPNTKLISVQMLNSELGTLQDISGISKIAKKHSILFHSDASQSFCKYDIDVQKLGVDLLTISGYKIGAPKGIAALYAKSEEILEPLFFGSGRIYSPGTTPTALIAAFAKAVENFYMDKVKIEDLYLSFTNELKKIEDIVINSTSPSFIVSFSIGGVELQDLIQKLPEFSFSSGCSCNATSGSDVIRAIDPNGKLPKTTLRISFSDKIKKDVLIKFALKLKEAVHELRKKNEADKCGTPEAHKEELMQKFLANFPETGKK